MNNFIKTTFFSLFLFITQGNVIEAGSVDYLEQMKKIQIEAKKQADEHATELTRLQRMFNKQKKPQNIPVLPKDQEYLKKYRTVDADLKELNKAIRDDTNKLLAPLPQTPTEDQFKKHRDLLVSFGNNATRTLAALRDEMKWLKGKKKAKFELFQNYEAANRFLLLK